ncbi:hypothetical protein [Microbulbifer sp. ZKSA002]|uniref:hypothetical protein n=1 Tax=Microbulbifer sp. ZKSA002 TaxID=3243388 RepID=UPI004039AD99
MVETISAIETTDLEYLIVGGWSSYLLNKTDYQHPGTKDVDILFSDGDIKGKIGSAIQALLNHGFIISAKHDFQMFKILNVNGGSVVYHIDLLHPQETRDHPELMVDHFDLGLNEDDISETPKIQRSIALPSSKFLFDGFYNSLSIEHPASNGQIKRVDVPLIDEAGLIFSKCKSAQVPKRPRDSYDIFLALKQPNVDSTVSKLKNACAKYPKINESVKSLISFIEEEATLFAANIAKYSHDSLQRENSDYCLSKLRKVVST